MMLRQKSLFRDKVFIAIPEEPRDAKSVLSWVIDHTSDSAEIIIIHIVTSPNFERQQQILDSYVNQCSRKKVRAEKRVFLFTKIDEGLVHLIKIYGITQLVMGAAADRHYRRKMKAPESQTAMRVMQQAQSYCNIWFICKGKLIFFREANYCLLTKSKSARPICGVGNPKMDLQSFLEPNLEAKRLEYMYIKEMKLRKETEEELCQQKEEIVSLKQATLVLQNELDWYRYQWNENASALEEVNQQKRLLEHQISESDCIASCLGESMRASDSLVQSLKLEYSKVKRERDAAIKEARDMRMEKELIAPCAYGAMNSEFSLMELEQATQVFCSSLNIGRGGFGSVYKGFLRSTTVAIKILDTESLHAQSQFQQEVAVLSRVRHPNLVTLIGACPEASALVYEFLPNGSLEDRLNCVDNTPPLTWQVRIRIIREVCSALIFLHKHKPHPVVHGDLKPGNILLDANLLTKVSDFGISRLLLESSVTDSDAHFTSQPMGTPAYMDPEFFGTGELTPQSDTYSFGVTILRLLTGMAPLRLIRVVQGALNDDDLHSVLDHSAGEWPLVLAEQLARIGLQCSELSRQKRPDLQRDVWRLFEPMIMEAPAPLSQSFRSMFSESSRVIATPSSFLCPITQVTHSKNIRCFLQAVRPRVRKHRTVFDALQERRWVRDITGALTVQVILDYLDVWELLRSLQLHENVQDIIKWRWTSDGRFSTASAYRSFFIGQHAIQGAKLLYKAKAPPKCKFFIWTVLHERCWTAARRKRHNLQDDDTCILCAQDSETINHLLVNCPYSREVWFHILRRLNWEILGPQMGESSFADWWAKAHKRTQKNERRTLDTAVILIAWCLWLERNARTFNRQSRTVSQLVHHILQQMDTWAVMRDPQVAADGFTYEADALRCWLDSGHDTSPVTNETLSNRDSIPNHALRSAIQEYLRQNKLFAREFQVCQLRADTPSISTIER